MALIVCKNCGKNISDTVETCIHCGTPTKQNLDCLANDKPLTPPEKTTCDNEKYNDMPENIKVELENEFLSHNLAMLNYKQKIRNAEKLTTIFWRLFGVGAVILTLSRLVSGYYTNKPLLIVFSLYTISMIAIGLIGSIIYFFIKNKRKSKYKNFVYYKEFKLWLLKVKNIDYEVTFTSDSDQKLFDNLVKKSKGV